MYSEFLKINLVLALVLITAPAEITLAFDKNNSSIESYSPGVLAIIRENEKLLDKNLNRKVIKNLKLLVEKKSLNNFEKCSLYFILGTAYFKLNDILNSNKMFLNVLTFERIPLLLHIESLKRLSAQTLNNNQKEYVKIRIREINNKQTNPDLLIGLAKFFYDCMEFDQAIEILDAVASKNGNLTSAQIDKLNEEAYNVSEDTLNEILPKAFAVVKETAKRFVENKEVIVEANDNDIELSSRKDYIQVKNNKSYWKNTWDAAGKNIVWDMVHYDVQLIGGVAMHQGKIAEMQTGEGKTLVATLPVYLNALTGRGVHLVTVNDYLAKRDSAWMSPIFEFHGLSVDCIDYHKPNSAERKKAYNADITYGTNNEFGFDYLRDNMANSPDDLVQRKHNFAIVDEVDSVLIDDARTPLIISGAIPKGDKHEFNELKPKIERIVSTQRKLLVNTLAEAKNLINSGNEEEGSFNLLRVFRGIPKNKALIKYLSEEGVKQLLQKTENFYMQDNNREMPKVDKDLYYVIDEKNNQIELTDKGIEFL